MAEDTRQGKGATTKSPTWQLFPFFEQLFVIVLFGALAPGALGISLISQGRLTEGIVVLVIWTVSFGWLALFLHRRNRVRLSVSISCAVLALGAFYVVFFAP